MQPTFEILRPAGESLPLVFDSPHSGAHYPDDFHFICPQHWLRQTEDRFVDQLFSGAPLHGACLLKAHITRNYIDLNRAVDDLDPVFIDGTLPFHCDPTERAISGYGLIRHLCRGQKVYAGRLTAADVMHRLDTCYYPYHAALQNMLRDAQAAHGAVWHVNCHSMPSSVFNRKRPDFILGDRDGTSSEYAFVKAITGMLQAMGYSVTHNDPYKGVELVRRSGLPREGFHSVQLEINRALYMDEETLVPLEQFSALKTDMARLCAMLKEWVAGRLEPQRMAAE